MCVDNVSNDLEILDKHRIKILGYAVCIYDVDYTPICTEYDAGSENEFLDKIRELESEEKVFTAIIRTAIEDKYKISIYYLCNCYLKYWKIADLENHDIMDRFNELGPVEKLVKRGVLLNGYPILERTR